MGATTCCNTNQKLQFEPEITNVQQKLQPQSKLLQDFLQSHQTIKNILSRQSAIAQLQQQLYKNNKNIKSKAQFIRKAHKSQLLDGTIYITCGENNKESEKRSETVIAVFTDEGYYEGQWVDGIKNGKGVLIDKQGQYYCGEWNFGVPHGYGIYSLHNPPNYYKGSWFRGYKHGYGEEISFDGSKYAGMFVYQEKTGIGKLHYNDGTQYEGQLKNNKPDGLGKFRGKGHNYEGTWKAGKMHGSGLSQWLNKNNQVVARYFGQYKDGVKEGYGQYSDSKGVIYKGMWINGQMNDHAPIDIQKKQ